MGAKIVKMLNINQISNKYFLSKKNVLSKLLSKKEIDFLYFGCFHMVVNFNSLLVREMKKKIVNN